MPGVGAYSASKHAMEAITDVFRVELAPWNISVSAIEPGGVRTPLALNSLQVIDSLWDQLSHEDRELYKRNFTVLRTRMVPKKNPQFLTSPKIGLFPSEP